MVSCIEISHCNVCGSHDLRPFLHLPHYSLIQYPLPPEVKANLGNLAATMPLRYGICGSDGHLVLIARPTPGFLQEFYEKFYETYPSRLELGFATGDADEFLSLFGKHLQPKLSRCAPIMEIGCHDGYVMHHLAREGFRVTGCDPSEGARIGRRSGLDIVQDYYAPELFAPRSFEAVLCRNVIEHVERPVDFLASIRPVMAESGYLFLETPDGAYYLEAGTVDPFAFEHLSVFTPASLGLCLEKAGFSVVRMLARGGYLRAICTSGAHEPTTGEAATPERLVQLAQLFGDRLQEYLTALQSLVQELSAQGKTLALWGAGTFGNIILTLLRKEAEHITAVVDRDPKKQGMSFLNVNVTIKTPEYLVEHPVDYILVSSIFGTEIVRDIRERYGLGSRIVLLTPRIHIID